MCAVLDSDHSQELEQEDIRLALGCMQIGRSNLGAALKSEIERLVGRAKIRTRLPAHGGRLHAIGR
jgi:hypothetical protein